MLEMYMGDMQQYFKENGTERVPHFYVYLSLLRRGGYFGLADAGFTLMDAVAAIGRNPRDVLAVRETQSDISSSMKNKLWNDFALPFGSAIINDVRTYGIPNNKTELIAIRKHQRSQVMGRLKSIMRIERPMIASEIDQLLISFEE
jgi:hypothetical protein